MSNRTNNIKQSLGRLGFAVATGLFLLASACSASDQEGAEAEVESGRLTVELAELELSSISLPGGNVVSWYELEPGVIATRESFTYPSPPQLSALGADVATLSAVELHRTLAPELPVPERLQKAFDRSQTLAFAADLAPIELDEVRLDGAAAATLNGDGTAQLRQAVVDDSACSWTWFAPHCNLCADGPCGDWRVSWPQITGDSKFSRKGSITRAAMCVYRGAVRHVFRLRGKDIQDTIQHAGNGTTFYLNNGSHDFTLGSRVEQAAGDGYHHCGQGS